MPEAIASSLREAYALSALRNARLFRETAFAVSALSEAGIPTLLLKGLHLASEVYEEPALRSMADLDLMVPLPQLAEAERVLLNRGYGSRPRRDVAAQARRLHHLAGLEHPTGEIIELHHTIEAPTSPFRIESETLWAGARQIQIEDVAAYVLSDEHLLLHLCLHLSYHHGFRRAPLKGLVDLATLLEAAGEGSEAEVANAKLNLSYTEVRAPITGLTSLQSPSIGTLIQAQQTLLTTITPQDRAYVSFSFTDEEGQTFRELNERRRTPIT
jgi:hypothetical protein